MKKRDFRKDIERLINKHSRENASNTPDFILAEYVSRCLDAFDLATRSRDNWYKYKSEVVGNLTKKPMLSKNISTPK